MPILALILLVCLLGGCVHTEPDAVLASSTLGPTQRLDQQASLPTHQVVYDLYLPAGDDPAPLIIVAHGFWRDRHNMALWGKRLAAEGFIVAVPNAPRWANHEANTQAIRELVNYLATTEKRVDPARIGLAGFSAGGCYTLLACSNPRVCVWVGLDPVLPSKIPREEAIRLTMPAYILRAEPASANLRGNIRVVQGDLRDVRLQMIVRDAVHVDPEWPTDAMAQWACGRSDDARRAAFVEYAVAAFRWELMHDPKALAILQNAPEDLRLRDVHLSLPAAATEPKRHGTREF